MTSLILALLLKSGVIAAGALALSALPGLRSPRDRVDILRTGVCMLLALPVVMALGPALTIPLLPAVPAVTPVAPIEPVFWTGDVGPVGGVSMTASILTPSAATILAWAWGLGAIAVIGRFAHGLWKLNQWTRQGRPVTRREWIAPLEDLSPARRPRLVASGAIAAPLSWGLPPGVVLIDQACLARPEAARSVLAHELAHVRRRDWLFLTLSRLALAMFWFNPVVWALHAVLIARTEDAADAAALAEVDPPTYARTLVTLAADYGNPAAVGIAGPARSLARRITRIMKTRRPHSRSPLATVLAVGGLIIVAAPVAALELAPRQIPSPPPAPSAPMAPPVPIAPSAPMIAPVALAAPMAPPAPPSLAPEAAPAAPAAPAWAPVPPVPAAMPAPPAPPAPPARPQDVITIDGRQVHYRDLTPEERERVDAARAEARRAREQAREARAEAAVARTQALAAAREARAHADEARTQARAQVREGRAAAERARVEASAARAQAAVARDQARVAREQAVREVANARVHMAQGAEQMDRGAEQMRAEAVRLRDPAYRARQIERARERGDRVPTDAELAALSPRLERQAQELAANADRMRAQAARAD